ncbi:Kinesin light chain [Actinoplanes sp. SE50]|uniref:helix-turn-helix domain-containing protein n=1 Tax=unclassified Actinoplanes TaxID=2626549 RepID=UPI0002E42FC3|nr:MULTISPECIES: tetratricopeptide repeat protein [unclassified Actinoplanes]ATO81826.1 Kinesin light chain [Actinoplanes sp. SE50]SLL99234.1 transcriptional regulator [Actinoplanes sp. SE50/110]
MSTPRPADDALLQRFRDARTAEELLTALNWYRTERNRSQRQVAEKAVGTPGLSKTRVNDLLTGRYSSIDGQLLRPLAQACGVDREELLEALDEAWRRIVQNAARERSHRANQRPAPPPRPSPDAHLRTLSVMAEIAGRMTDPDTLPLAQEIYERVLEQRRLLLGEDDPLTLTTQHNLGVVHFARDNLRAAYNALKIAYEARLATLGESAMATLTSQESLAVVCSEMGETFRAEQLLAECLAHRQEWLAQAPTEAERARLRVAAQKTADNLRAVRSQLGGTR